MYLGIDFLISPDLKPFVVEVNVGLPGGAEEYHRTHLVYLQKPSDIFARIEEISRRVYGRPFQNYLESFPFLKTLKTFKIWMDGQGPFPSDLHPGLRLEDKWVQYQILNSFIPMPETMVFDAGNIEAADLFLGRKGRLVLKRRLGRGGRNFRIIDDHGSLQAASPKGPGFILQDYISSKIHGYVFSVRSVAFGGEHLCLYANLSLRVHSNHGILAYIKEGSELRLADQEFRTEVFDQKSWEAGIWFGGSEPSYLHHNLYEDEVARTALSLPGPILRMIQDLSVSIERFYDGLDLDSLPRACFEEDSRFVT